MELALNKSSVFFGSGSFIKRFEQVTKEMSDLCSQSDPVRCLCGGNAQFLLGSHDKSDCLIQCTKCKNNTGNLSKNPSEATKLWDTGNRRDKGTCSLSVTVAQPVSIEHLEESVQKYSGIRIPRCGCGGGVSLVLHSPSESYSLCHCGQCGFETELQETQDAAIARWVNMKEAHSESEAGHACLTV